MKYCSTWHILHFIISCMTMGFWIPIWIVITLRNMQKNKLEEMRMMGETLKEIKSQKEVAPKKPYFNPSNLGTA